MGARGYADAMSKTRRWHEAGVLLLPVLALGGAALWKGSQATRPAQARAPKAEASRFVIEKVEQVSARPQDVAEGLDTRFEMAIGYSGARPVRWGEKKLLWSLSSPLLLQKQGEKWAAWRAVDPAYDFVWHAPQFDQTTQTYKTAFLFHLSDAPRSPGEVRFQASLASRHALKSGFYKSTPGIKATFSVLKAGEKVLRPQNALFHSPLKLAQVALSPPPPGTDPTTDLFLVARLKPSPAPRASVARKDAAVEASRRGASDDLRLLQHLPNPTVQPFGSSSPTAWTGSWRQTGGKSNAYLEDELGRRYPRPDLQSFSSSKSLADGNVTLSWRFSRRQLPQARRLTFHTRVSSGEGWPAEIKAVLWDTTRSTAKS